MEGGGGVVAPKAPLKGTVSRDFLLLVFFHESVSPQPRSIPLEPFQIFSKIRGDIDIGGKFATNVNDTAATFASSFASVVDNLPPV